MEDFTLYWMTEAVNLANEYEEITASEYFTESSNKLQERQNTNEKVKGGFVNAIKNAIASIRQMISEIATKVSNAIQKLFMSKEQKALFSKYEEKIKSNSSLANKTVKVSDFKKLDAAYVKALAEADKAANEEKDPSFGEEILRVLKENTKEIGITCGVGAAIAIFKNSQKISEGVSTILSKEDKLLESMEKTIGKEATNDIKSASKKYSKKTFWSRFKVNLCRRKNDDIVSKCKNTISAISTVLKDGNSPEAQSIKLNAAAKIIENPKTAKMASTALRGAAKVQDAKASFNRMRNKR